MNRQKFKRMSGCSALGQLAANNNDNRIKIFNLKGIQHVFNAMKQYPDNEDVQKHGMFCNVLDGGFKIIY